MPSSTKTAGSHFPWRPHCKSQLLVDGKQFYPAILEAIAQARQYILIEMYLVESGEITGRFIHQLSQKARAGIHVRLIFDAFGSLKLSLADRQRLKQAGVALYFYNPVSLKPFSLSRLKRNLHRTHRKIIVIDGKVAFTGGAGITDHFVGQHGWRETMLRIEGAVVADWQQLFVNLLQKLSNKPVSFVNPPLALPVASRQRPPNRARVVYSSGGRKTALKRSLLKRIKRSRHTVWMTTAYFIPTRKLRRALQRAAYQGKDVRLLLPGEVSDHPAVVAASRRYYARLLRHGVRIYEYRQRFMHAKVIVVDQWCSIGSSNMDRWNLAWNLEANQEIVDSHFARDVKDMLRNDWQHSKEILYNEWVRRSRWQRFKEWLWGNVDLWLTGWQDR